MSLTTDHRLHNSDPLIPKIIQVKFFVFYSNFYHFFDSCDITVGINPRLSDLKGPGTSKLDWRYLVHNKIDRNELPIRTNSEEGTGTKIAEKLNNFEKLERKKVKFQPCS